MLDVTSRRPAVLLSPRVLEVVDLLRAGLAPKEIAGQLHISVWTVYGYAASARLATRSRTNEQMVHRIPRAPAREV